MLDWKLVDDIQTLLCLYLCFKSLLQEYTFYGIKIMTEHEYWLLFPSTTLTTNSTHQQRLTTKMRSKLQKLHHRTRPFSVLCALRNFSTSWSLESTGGARAAASFWRFLSCGWWWEPQQPWFQEHQSPWHAVMSWHQQKPKDMRTTEKKTVKSQKLPQEIAFQTWFYIVIASLASNSWSSMIQYPPPPKKNIKNPPPNSLGLFGRDGVPQLLSSLPLPFLSRYGPRAVHSPQVRYVAPSEGPRPSLPLLPGDRHKWGPPKIRGFR